MTGDHDEFLELTLPHLDVVWSIARRLARPPHEPEDLVQETYLKAFASFDRKRAGDTRAWLVAICLNTARSHARRVRRRPTEVPLTEGDVPSQENVSEQALGAVEREALEDALAALPDPQRIAILLMDVAGMSARQTGEVVGAPRGTILARVHRGRRKLVQLLEEMDVIDGL
ncbi:MAG: RNA polymerase sigma factor [Candidatus Binatia bacterium]